MTSQTLTITTTDGRETILTHEHIDITTNCHGVLEAIVWDDDDEGYRTLYAWSPGHWATWTLTTTPEV